jgi:hypothetical protein
VVKFGIALLDDGGISGDRVAGDSVFTTNAIRTDCCAVAGPRWIRVKAETIDPGGRRHASTVDGAAFEVQE